MCRPRFSVLCPLALCALVATGCQIGHIDDPIAVMLDRHRAVSQRLAAAEQLGPIDQSVDEVDEPDAYRRALSQLAWSDRQPIELRRIAIDRLIAHDRDAFLRDADRYITRVRDWATLEHIFDHAAAQQWRAFAPVAIRSYARPTDQYNDHDRPEHALLTALHPDQPVEQTVFEVFIADDEAHGFVHQAAAWRVAHRLHDHRGALRAWLEAAPPEVTLARDLRAAAAVLEELPVREAELEWLVRLRAMDDGEWWRAAIEGAAALTSAQRLGLALRHLPLLIEDDEALEMERTRLRMRIIARLRDRTRVTRTRGVTDPRWTESFEDQHRQMAWGDLLAIDMAQRALADPDVKRALFEQADADRLDESSEHGGAFVREADGWRPEAFAPAVRLHGRRYVASYALIEQMHTALAHYHFHAQRYANAEFAGPGAGDLAFAARFGCHALVLTFIDRDTLNADYYQPDGLVVDLGHLTRPQP